MANRPVKRAFLIPAYNPGPLLEGVLDSLLGELRSQALSDIPIVCVDDGCSDGSIDKLSLNEAYRSVLILRHEINRGKGAALKTGLEWARSKDIDEVITLDADGQHPASEAVRLLLYSAPQNALVLAVRDMKAAGAPASSQASNAFSNWVLSLMGGETLHDTQCGLRRYPVAATLQLAAPSPGYAFESDLVLRAARRGLTIVHEPFEVLYPEESERVSFFDSTRDPTRIVFRVVATTFSIPHHRAVRRWGRRVFIASLVGALLFLYSR